MRPLRRAHARCAQIEAAENALVALPTLWSPHLQELRLGWVVGLGCVANHID